MNEEAAPLTGQQLRAVQFIAKDLPTVAIAEELGINHGTLWRWRQDPKFSAEVSRLSEVLREENKERVAY